MNLSYATETTAGIQISNHTYIMSETFEKPLQPPRTKTFIEQVRKISIHPVYPSVANVLHGNNFIIMPSKSTWFGKLRGN